MTINPVNWLSRLLSTIEARAEFSGSSVEVGKTYAIGDEAFHVDSEGECPFITCPSLYESYGRGGRWLLLWWVKRSPETLLSEYAPARFVEDLLARGIIEVQ